MEYTNFEGIAKTVILKLQNKGLEINQQNILDIVHEKNGEGYSIWKDEFINKSSDFVELEKAINELI